MDITAEGLETSLGDELETGVAEAGGLLIDTMGRELVDEAAVTVFIGWIAGLVFIDMFTLAEGKE